MIAELIEKIASNILNSSADAKLKGFWISVICVAGTNFLGWCVFQGLRKSYWGKNIIEEIQRFLNRLCKHTNKQRLEKLKVETYPVGTTFESFEPIAGDIFLSTDNSWWGKTINFFQSMWTKKSIRNHAGTWIGKNNNVEALVKITKSPKTKYAKRKHVTYRIPLSNEEREAVRTLLLERVGGAYGFDKYPLFFLDCITTWIKKNIFGRKTPCFWFTKTFHISNIPVCSELVVWAIHKVTSYRFKDENGNEINWTIVSPDYLEDLLKLPINNAIRVFEQDEIK